MPEYRRVVRPAAPLAPWQGGKRNLAQRLIDLIDQIDHDGYAEPFVGMGGVFLRRGRAPELEVINDINRDVANLFRILQRHYVAFLDMMKFQITSRTEFERLAATDPGTLTDLERAARFLYLQRTAYGGKVTGQHFGIDQRARFDITKLGPLLEAVHERLAGVVVECLPYGDFIERYDRPGMLFYLDPPYFGSEGDYGRDIFQPREFRRLAHQLAKIEGTFLLSINDHPEIREIFAEFELREVETSYGIAKSAAVTAAELVIAPRGQALKGQVGLL